MCVSEVQVGGEGWRWNMASLCVSPYARMGSRQMLRGFCSSGGGGPSWLRVSFMRSRTSQCGCLKWIDQSWGGIGYSCSQQSGVDWVKTHSHGSLGGFPIWLNDRGIHCCSCRCCSLKRSKRLVQCQGGLVCVPHEQCWRGIRYYCNAITSPGYTVIFFLVITFFK